MTCYIPRWLTRPQAVTHPSTNRAQCRLTTLIEANALTTTLCCHPCASVFVSVRTAVTDSTCDLSDSHTVACVVVNIVFFLSVLGNALDEDLGRLNLASLATEQDADIDSNSLSSPLSSSLSGAASAGMSGLDYCISHICRVTVLH